jgi:hypothetical protein
MRQVIVNKTWAGKKAPAVYSHDFLMDSLSLSSTLSILRTGKLNKELTVAEVGVLPI